MEKSGPATDGTGETMPLQPLSKLDSYNKAKEEVSKALHDLEIGIAYITKASPPRSVAQIDLEEKENLDSKNKLEVKAGSATLNLNQAKSLEEAGQGDNALRVKEITRVNQPVSSENKQMEMDAMLKKCKDIALNKAFHHVLIKVGYDEKQFRFII